MTKQVFTASQVLTAAQMNSLQNNDFNWDTSTKTVSYVLLAADAGTRVIMNSASATTITVNTGLFAAGDVLWIHNINTGTCTITAGTATVNSAGSLALAQWEGGALYFTSAGSAIFFRGGARNTLSVEFLLVGGGGGGGRGTGGGGGAGGFVTGSGIIGKTTYTVTVGAGGAGSTNGGEVGRNGTASSFIRSANGGGGGGSDTACGGQNGGSGGGNGNGQRSGGAGISGEGNNAGTSTTSTGNAGGGGAGGTGGNGSAGAGGNGGAASTNNYTGSSISYSGGGGGSGSTTGGTAGTNGGNGGANAAGSNATANRGGGGGGSYTFDNGGNGGSGRVVIRWLTANATGLSISTTGSPTTGTDGSYTWYAWDSTGTLVVA